MKVSAALLCRQAVAQSEAALQLKKAEAVMRAVQTTRQQLAPIIEQQQKEAAVRKGEAARQQARRNVLDCDVMHCIVDVLTHLCVYCHDELRLKSTCHNAVFQGMYQKLLLFNACEEEVRPLINGINILRGHFVLRMVSCWVADALA